MKWTGIALTVGTVMLAATAGAAASKAENGLLGVKLYDSGTRVISIYGTPDEIDAVNIGGGAAGSGSPFGGSGAPGGPGGRGFGGPPGMPGGRNGGPGGKMGGGAGADFRNGPFDFGTSILQSSGAGGMAGASSAGAQAPAAEGNGRQGGFGGPPGMPPGAGGPGAGAGPRGNGGAAESATYTRWIYRRNGSQYGFVFDKFNHVVQIEAIGIANSKVKTSRGVGFGSTFAQIIKAYQAPDGYEISGDNVLVKFLSKAKVAFRLSRLGEKKPQVVTGIVVAAAKG